MSNPWTITDASEQGATGRKRHGRYQALHRDRPTRLGTILKEELASVQGVRVPTSGSLRVVVRPHWLNAWVLIPFARPYVRIDGQEYACRWKQPRRVDVTAGRHAVETFIRYRGVATALGTGRLEVDVSPGRETTIAARNGWLNHMPFRPEVQASGG